MITFSATKHILQNTTYLLSISYPFAHNLKPQYSIWYRSSAVKFGTEWRRFSQARASVLGDHWQHERRARWHAEAILGIIELRSLSVRSKSIRLCEVKSQALWMRNVARRSSDGDLGHGGRSNNRRRRSRS